MSRRTIADVYALLVEPSRAQRRIIVEQLESLGLTDYSTVDSGEAALACVRESVPDLVLSAMYLPDMTGTDLLVALRSVPRSADVGFVLVSSETTIDQLIPIRQAGASAILPKPFRAKHLARALATCLDVSDPGRLDLGDFHPEELDVLVVDDSALARKAIVRTLRGMGIDKITEANDGHEAIGLIERAFYDLVVTDYNMPSVDGAQLVEHVRRESSQRTVPIMMVTTEGDLGKLAAVERAGVSAICDKPFEPTTVKAIIERIVSGF